MSDTALFIGWGGTYPGREQSARTHYAEWTEILERLKADGEIEGFETVLLAPHGGELDGFTMVFGSPEKLAALRMREDLRRLQTRAALDHAKFSVIWATVGVGVEREFSLVEEAISEYERQPALV
ncbi:MAG TPA: hypothetical protein VFL61_15145 [Gaiellaceae bacterium]|nr:hypothetical protein [Gaiellaceae bacterium]